MGKHEAFVYMWTNLNIGSVYIGYHKGAKDDGYICSSQSKRFWDDYKNPEYEWERIILFEGTQKECVEEELRILKGLDLSDETYYNNSKGGGIIFSNEVRKKMSDAKKGKKGPKHSEETIKKMSDAKKGKVYSLDTRKKMSDGMKGRKPWNHGKTTSEESRKKMSEAKKGITWPEETVQKRAESNRGRTRKKVVCPFCQKEGGEPAMIRWHFENCKNK